MCGRYALGIRAAFVRHQLQQQGMPVDEAPEDDDVRQTYNFAPGYYGLVYRANVPDTDIREQDNAEDDSNVAERPEPTTTTDNDEPTLTNEATETQPEVSHNKKEVRYQLKAMKWGLIPFWTKRNPDYGSLMRTINCRDDSLIEDRGMWTSMKRKKRCVVVCQGFYEWLKKGPSGKEKLPHFVRRKDGELMCFAGLWDCVKYEGSEEKVYTYSIITTDPNPYLKFLHDRMPVILDAGSEGMNTWLDPYRNTWSKELQSLLKPYKGELECYPVSKEVGKVGNNSPDFIVPLDSKDNKNNIANFFANAKGGSPKKEGQKTGEVKVEHEHGENRRTKDEERSEDNAPVPIPKEEENENKRTGLKREHSPDPAEQAEDEKPAKAAKTSPSKSQSSPKKQEVSPVKSTTTSGRKTRSATSNGTVSKSGSPKKAGDGSQRITNFFVK